MAREAARRSVLSSRGPVLAAADTSPVGRVMLPLPADAREGTWRLRRTPDGWADVDDGEDVLLEVGLGVTAGHLAMAHMTGLPRGASAAEAALDLLPAIAARTGTDLRRLDAAVERRS